MHFPHTKHFANVIVSVAARFARASGRSVEVEAFWRLKRPLNASISTRTCGLAKESVGRNSH